MDCDEIVEALTALAAELTRRGTSAEMYVVGGATAPVLDLPGLRCLAASPEKLLALKVLAHRVGEDESDLRLLAAELGLTNAGEILVIAERTFGDRLDAAARFFVEQVFGGGTGARRQITRRYPNDFAS